MRGKKLRAGLEERGLADVLSHRGGEGKKGA
jgi:hypothetical protein